MLTLQSLLTQHSSGSWYSSHSSCTLRPLIKPAITKHLCVYTCYWMPSPFRTMFSFLLDAFFSAQMFPDLCKAWSDFSLIGADFSAYADLPFLGDCPHGVIRWVVPKSVGNRYTRRSTKSPHSPLICHFTWPQVTNWKLSVSWTGFSWCRHSKVQV